MPSLPKTLYSITLVGGEYQIGTRRAVNKRDNEFDTRAAALAEVERLKTLAASQNVKRKRLPRPEGRYQRIKLRKSVQDQCTTALGKAMVRFSISPDRYFTCVVNGDVQEALGKIQRILRVADIEQVEKGGKTAVRFKLA